MRQVAGLIKGKPVEEALNILNYTPKAAAYHMAKTLKAAAANAISGVGTAKLKAEDLSISKVFVDQAPTAKRVRFQSMGRVFRLRKRFCHLTIIVEGEPEKEKPRATRARKPRAKKAAAGTETESETDTKKAPKKRAKKSVKTKAKAKKAEAKPDAEEPDTEEIASDKAENVKPDDESEGA